MSARVPPANIIAWCHRHFDVKERKGGKRLVFNNPFDGDTGRHFSVSPYDGWASDWRGNSWSGPPSRKTGKPNCSFIHFVQLYLKCDHQTALRDVLGASADLSEYLRPRDRQEPPEREEEPSLSLPDGARPLWSATGLGAICLKNWLAKRGVGPELVESRQLYYRGDEVIWPYFEYGELVYWQSRSRLNKRFTFPDESVGVTKGQFLYGFDEVEPASYAILTEAIFDCLVLGENAMASGGAIITPDQVQKLRLLGPKDGIILAPDNDKAGIKSICSNYKLLLPLNLPLFYSIPPELPYTIGNKKKTAKDWSDLGRWICGFDKVRRLMEDELRKLDQQALVELRKKC